MGLVTLPLNETKEGYLTPEHVYYSVIMRRSKKYPFLPREGTFALVPQPPGISLPGGACPTPHPLEFP